MPKIGGRQVEVGIGIEAVVGTPVAATISPKWAELSIQGIAEKSLFTSSRGIRNETGDSIIRRKYAQGSIGVVANVEIAPYLFGLALGSVATALTGGESAVWDHTITVQNLHASMKAATVLIKDGAIVTEQITNGVVDSLNFEVSDEFARLTAEFIGKFPASGSHTAAYTQETEFAYHQMTAKFGTDLAAAAGNSATPLKAFTLNINNNVQLDDAFLSGSNDVAAGGLIAGQLQITGSYTLHFEDTVELAKYKANTKNALIIELLGAAIGVVTSTETIKISLGRVILTSPPKEYNIDGVVVLTQEFTVEYEATDKEITVLIVNEKDGTDY